MHLRIGLLRRSSRTDDRENSATPAKARSARETRGMLRKNRARQLIWPHPAEAVMTEIYADEAFFDSANHIGIFTGHVIVNDPRFTCKRTS